MSECKCRLGVGLIPTEDQISKIYKLAKELSVHYDLSFWIKSGISIPHVTLFQGKFRNEEEVIKAMKSIDLSHLNSKQALSGLSVWAQKIVFLDCEKNEDLLRAHELVYRALFPLCEGESADLQKFEEITDGQQRSFKTTGYPFSLDEYLPHFTMAHLNTPHQADKVNLQKIFEKSDMGKEIIFDKIVLYRVGDLGRCLEFANEKKLK